jgi:acyl-CoA synthetase (AMP-forming)/AMP-acid ligase II
MAADTLVAVVRGWADRQPERPACGFLPDGEGDLVTLTYARLDSEARRIADLLASRLAPGSRALLLYEPGLDFITAFFGCLYAGVTAVPVFPPAPPRLDLGLAKLKLVLRDSGAEAVLAAGALRALAASLPGPGERLLATDQPGQGDPAAWRDPGLRPGTVAFLQYTSGSTADPKGVVLTHENLLANQRAIAWALQIPADAVMVSWLPTYHDMGLIGSVLHPLSTGSSCYLISPLHFLARPARWLELVTRFRGYISGAPNFAYDLCARRVSEEERAGLDLSSWRIAFNGSEPIRAGTVRRFQEAFAPCGFRPEALVGCYGLAEATLLVAGAWASDPKLLTVDREEFARGSVRRRQPGAPGEIDLAPSGRVPPDHEVRIVDPETALPAAGAIGEIWVSGPSVSPGYLGRPEESEAILGARLADGTPGRWLRTGDLGFVMDGLLYVTGRRKDLLVLRGRNVHPHDLEDAAQLADARLRKGGGVAFPLELDGEEAPALIQETTAVAPPDLAALARVARSAVLEAHQVRLGAVYLVPPRSVLKTSSGKLRREASRDALLAGRMTVLFEDRAGPVDGAGAPG